MSTTLFRSKQFKSRRSLNKLSISSPISYSSEIILSPTSINNSTSILENTHMRVPRQNTIGDIDLCIKYDFRAENEEELSVKTNDVVKLLERPGDGWLKVQSIKTGMVGLIPASYVRISVNDLLRPVTMQWLNEVQETEGDDLFDFEKIAYVTDEPKITFFPKTVDVSNVFQDKERYWYRVDIKMSNGDKVYLCKRYQDFYNLHVNLVSLNYPNLPRLPQPTKHKSKDRKYLESLLTRCTELNVYINKLVKISEYQTSTAVMEWIFHENSHRIVNPPVTNDDYVNEALRPNSVNLLDILHSQLEKAASAKALPASPNGSLTTTRSHNRLVHSPSDNTLFSFGSLIDRYDDRDARDRENSTSSDTQESIFSKSPVSPHSDHSSEEPISTPTTPDTPTFIEHKQAQASTSFVKVKIILNNKEKDIIVIKVDKSTLRDMKDLKRLVSKKIYQDSNLIEHYRLHSGEIEKEEEVFQTVKGSFKVTLQLIRNRRST